MAKSTDPLREQLARLLNPLWNKLGSEVYEQVMAQVDSLLPLFATRERAAAEKAWDGAATNVRVEQIHADMALIDAVSPPRYIFTETQREGFRAAQSAAIRAVRAQLEGDGA